MQDRLYFTAQEVQEMLGVSRAKAYKIVKELNDELASKGFIVTAGKVQKKFLSEKYCGTIIQIIMSPRVMSRGDIMKAIW